MNSPIMYIVKEDKLDELSHKDIVRFALFCAYQIKDKLVNYNNHSILALKQVELWLEDKVTYTDCSMSANDLEIDNIVQYVVWSTNDGQGLRHYGRTPAYYAMVASTIAASNLLNNKIINEQVKYYNELRYVDDIFETIVLEGIEKPFR